MQIEPKRKNKFKEEKEKFLNVKILYYISCELHVICLVVGQYLRMKINKITPLAYHSTHIEVVAHLQLP